MEKRFELSEEFARKMDLDDPLKEIRARFYLNENEIYMDGNSLGLLSKDAEESLMRVLNEWKRLGIKGWMNAEIPWFYYAEELARLQAPLVGAAEDEVIVHSSNTIDLHCMVFTFFKPEGNKRKILVDELNFPSDRYATESQLKLKGLSPEKDLTVVKSRDGRMIAESDIVDNMTEEIALILLPSVLYRSGQLLDMAYLTREAHKKNIVIGFDCCHSVGAIPHYFSEWDVDFAFWCNYKYMNSGPGGAASMYVNRKHFNEAPALAGWYGYVKEKQFDMKQEFISTQSTGGWQVGTPHILSMAPLEGSLRILHEAGIDRIREKSLKMTAYLMTLIDHELKEYGFRIGNPREDNRRGGHVALEHDEAVRINEAIKDRGIVPDFRYPNIIRLAPVALYTSYHEIWRVVQVIKETVESRTYERYSKERGIVA